MVADEPADPRLLAQLIETSPQQIDDLCSELAAEYDREQRGFELVKIAGGWRFQSRAELAPYVERFVLTGQSARLSAAALETLAIVAYKQPISRAQVAAIRGVSVDGVMRTLQQRGYIAELARDPGPGQAVLFGTTSLFLERLGVNSLDELAPLGEFVPNADVVEALEQGLRVPADEAPSPAPDPNAPKWYDAPIEDAPIEDAPGEEVPGEDAPGEDAPGEEVPGEEVPGDELLEPAAPLEPLELDALDILKDDEAEG